MPNNILSAIIDVKAPNVAQTASTVSKATDKMAASFKRIGPVSNTATFALTNLGRVAQDLPFGFIGIANNINPLLESFQRLKTETGSTKIALQSLGRSMLGAGGLGFAVSVISSLFLFSALRSRDAGKATEEHTKVVDLAKEKQREFQAALDKASGAILQQTDRISGLKDMLISTNAEFSGLAKNIVNAAVVQFLFDKKNVEVQKLLNIELQKRLRTVNQLGDLPKVLEFNKDLFSGDKLTREAEEAKQGIETMNAAVTALGLNFDNVFRPTKELKVKVKPEDIRDPIQFPIPIEPTFRIEVGFIEKELFQRFKSLQPIPLDLKVGPINLDQGLNDAQVAFRKLQSFTIGQAQKTAEVIDQSIRNIMTSSFASIGEGIGKALAGGDIKDIFSSFANVLATGIEEIGKQIIALGVAGVLAKEALKKVFVNPFLAIAAGTALVAVGAALKSALGNGIRGFAAGGRFPAGEDILVGEKGPEIVRFNTGGNVIPNNKIGSAMAGSGSGGRVVFEIQGNKLVGVLANTNRYQSRNK